LVQRGRGCSRSLAIPILGIRISCGDIRDQSQKLSEIAPNFARFYLPKFLRCWPAKNLYPNYHARVAPRHAEKFREVTNSSRRVVAAHTLTLKPIFNFFVVKKLLGGPPSPVGCALSSLGHSIASVKISGEQRPLGPKYDLPKKSIWVVQSPSLDLCC